MDKYLKKTDGEVYGPVPVDDMVYWASEGRIAPDDQISDDSKHWTPAPDLPELGMEWMVALPDGSPYGPLHLYALVEFVRDAIVAPNTTITHKENGETFILSEALLSTLVDRNEALQNSVATLRSHLSELREREETVAKASEQAAESATVQEDLHRKLDDLRAQNQLLKDEAKEWESRFHQERKTFEEAAAEDETAVQKLESELSRLREKDEASAQKAIAAAVETEGLREELKAVRREVLPATATTAEADRILEQTRAEHKQERDQLRKQIKALEKKLEDGAGAGTYRELATTIDGQQKDISKWKKMYDDEREGARKREDTLKQRIEELRDNESNALARLEEVGRRLRHTQRSYEMMAKAGEAADGGPESVLSLQMSALMDSHNELSQSYDTLFTQLQEKAEELEGLMTERKETETRAEERVQGMETTLKREQEEADRARRQLADMQQSHFQLVKSYREMNDRFIRIRQEIDQGTAPAVAPPPEKPEGKGKGKPKAPAKGPRIRLNR